MTEPFTAPPPGHHDHHAQGDVTAMSGNTWNVISQGRNPHWTAGSPDATPVATPATRHQATAAPNNRSER